MEMMRTGHASNASLHRLRLEALDVHSTSTCTIRPQACGLLHRCVINPIRQVCVCVCVRACVRACVCVCVCVCGCGVRASWPAAQRRIIERPARTWPGLTSSWRFASSAGPRTVMSSSSASSESIESSASGSSGCLLKISLVRAGSSSAVAAPSEDWVAPGTTNGVGASYLPRSRASPRFMPLRTGITVASYASKSARDEVPLRHPGSSNSKCARGGAEAHPHPSRRCRG